jgi:transcriptional regulator NrdR family protein
MSERAKSTGLICRQCGCRDFRVTDTEPLKDGRIRRRRTCRHCGRRVVTFEITVQDLGQMKRAS